MLLQGHCSPLGRQLRSPPWATERTERQPPNGQLAIYCRNWKWKLYFKKVVHHSNVLMERKGYFVCFCVVKVEVWCFRWVLLINLTKFLQQVNMTSTKVIWLMECHRAISLRFHKKRWMFMKTQRSAERSIYFLDNSAESILALLLRDSHSTAIHLYATGFIYTLQTFIKANLMGVKKRGKKSTQKFLWKRSCCEGQILSK